MGLQDGDSRRTGVCSNSNFFRASGGIWKEDEFGLKVRAKDKTSGLEE